MVLPVVKYGDKVLREKAVPVVQVTPSLVKLAQDMISTMHKSRGVGLAAEQVGRLESLCVIDVPLECEDDDATKEFNARTEMPLVMFNPQILSLDGEQDGKEGCLSFPNMGAPLKRAAEVTVQYLDLNGMPQIATVRGFLARAVQHETDHLQGILYVDRLLPDDRAKIEKKIDSLCKKNGGCA
jgi:peptide deformylase